VLCWYQRILMYPLAIIIAIGIVRRDPKLHWYVLPLSLLGACVSLYHYLLVKTDWLPPPPCVAGIPCTVEYLNWFGFINIPFLALTAFLVISFTMIAATLGSWTSAAEDLSSEEMARPGGIMADVAVVGVIVGVVGSFLLAARFV
jgi:disulfide bond formation protein DsbB